MRMHALRMHAFGIGISNERSSTIPDDGLNDAIVGCRSTIKSFAEEAVFPLTVIFILPVVAPTGTVAINCVAVASVTVALAVPKLTSLLISVVLKFVPVIVTVAPAKPEAGLTVVIVGRADGVGSSFWQDTKKKNRNDIMLAMSNPAAISLI